MGEALGVKGEATATLPRRQGGVGRGSSGAPQTEVCRAHQRDAEAGVHVAAHRVRAPPFDGQLSREALLGLRIFGVAYMRDTHELHQFVQTGLTKITFG